MDVSIIIVNYKTRKLTSKLINSIIKNTKKINYEIILVDNASNDGSIGFFKKLFDIKIIENNENLGFGNANNIGLNHCKGKYVFLLNSDTELLNNAVFEFFKFAEKSKKNVSCIGCILKDAKLTNTHSFGFFPTMFNDLYFQLIKLPLKNFLNVKNEYCTYDFSKKPFYEVDYITGAALFIKKSVISKLGFFDPRFFMYYEETDLQKKYLSFGFKSVLINTPNIVHLCGGSEENIKRNLSKSIIQLKSKLLYFRKWNTKFSYTIYIIFLIFIRIPFLIFSNYKFKDKLKYFSILINNMK